MLTATSATIGAGSVVNGRVLAQTGVTTNDDQLYSAPPTMTLTGGATADTNDSDPTISGTTDVSSPGTVTVTVNGQALPAATPMGDGSWSVTPAGLLADATYTVFASTTDGAGNVGTATQQLTIDTVPPLITITGGGTVLTDDPTAAISGTTNAAAQTAVTVTVDGQTLTALVQSSGGTWNITPTALADGTYTVTAAVTDPAMNTSTTTAQLTVDTVAPVVIINGGASATTTSSDPTISGSTHAAPASTVTVTLAGQTMTTLVQPDGSFNASAVTVAVGSWQGVVTVSDPAGNVGTATQTLTVTSVAVPATGAIGPAGVAGATGPAGAGGTTGASGPTGSTRFIPRGAYSIVAIAVSPSGNSARSRAALRIT